MSWKCEVAGLGNADPTSVTFTHTGIMPTFTEVTIGTNVFIRIPKMYRKVVTVSSNQITGFIISDTREDSDYVVYPCFLKEDGTTEIDYILIGKYLSEYAGYNYSVATSNAETSVPCPSDIFRNACRNVGKGYQSYDWMMHKLWQDLMICKYNSVNIQDGTAKISVDALGFYHHNGEFVDGLCVDRGTNKYIFSYKPSKYDTYPTSSGSEYVETSYSVPTSPYFGEVASLGYDINNPFANFAMSLVSNSSYNTYYCDYGYIVQGTTRGGTVAVNTYNDDVEDGPFKQMQSLAGNISNFGRLCFRPVFDDVSFGGTHISNVCIGDSKVSRIYLADEIIYERLERDITVSLTNCTASASNVTKITPFENVTLVYNFDGVNYKCSETAPTVTGATVVSWTKDSNTQGTLVINNAYTNVSFSVVGVAIVSSSQVTLTGSGSRMSSYAAYDGTDTTGTELISGATGTNTVTVSSGHLYIKITVGSGSGKPLSNWTSSGGVSLSSYSGLYGLCVVDSDGTVSFSIY